MLKNRLLLTIKIDLRAVLRCVYGSACCVSDLRWCLVLPDGYTRSATAVMESATYVLKTGEWEKAVTASGCKVLLAQPPHFEIWQ